jgi:hypothetical protein
VVSLLAIALLLLMTPIWTHFAIAASGGTQATRDSASALALSDRTVGELFLGPGTFSDYDVDEAAHMRDVRLVLYGFLGIAAVSVTFIAWSFWRAPRDPATWRALSRGGAATIVLLIGLGVFAALAFDAAFELFHRLLFPGGNFEFPSTSLLIRLYPIEFWQLSAAAMSGLGITGGLLVWLVGRRRAAALTAP